MQPSPGNRIQNEDEVTPDLVVICGKDQGVVGEAKVSFHGSLEERAGEIRQLMKYDDDLTGWPTSSETLKNHDVVLLVHYTRQGDTQDILDKATDEGQLAMARSFAAVSFVRTSQADEYMSLHCFWGKMSSAAVQKRMRPLAMPLEKVRPHYPVWLYDAPPPSALLLQLAWDYVFSQLVSEEEYLGSGKRVFDIECTVDQVRQKLAETCGPAPIDDRDPPIPRRDWVVKMFGQLEKMRLAKCLDRNAGRYTVFYRRKQMAVDYFIDKLVAAQLKRQKKPKQVARAKGRRVKSDPRQGLLFGQ